MSEYGYRPDEEYPVSSRPDSAPVAEPYALQQQARYPDPHETGFQPYSGPYAQPHDTGHPTTHRYPGQGYSLQPHPRPPYPAQQEHPQAGTVLALGLIGLAVPVVSFVAWYLGSRTEHEIEDSGLSYANSGTIAVGKVLGMVVSILQIVGGGLALIWIVFAMMAALGSWQA